MLGSKQILEALAFIQKLKLPERVKTYAVASSCSCQCGQAAMALLGQNELRQAVVSRAPDGQLTLHTSILGSIVGQLGVMTI